jgi:hypothetical protein
VRDGGQPALIGITAAQLLDCVPCDLLIVKPRQFSCPVRPESRGTRFVTVLPWGGVLVSPGCNKGGPLVMRS